MHRKWIAFVADGFTDDTESLATADDDLARDESHEDLNLDDGELLIVSQNFVTAPFHMNATLRLPGRLLVQTASGQLAEVGSLKGVVNRR